MKVQRVGRLAGNEIVLTTKKPGHILGILTGNQFPQGVQTTELKCALILGEGLAAREILLDIPLSTDMLKYQQSTPTSVSAGGIFQKPSPSDDGYLGIFLFKDQIFAAETDYVEDASLEEALLLIKRHVYLNDARLKRLRQEVEAMERVLEYVGPKRKPIPEATKLIVYQRDNGACVRCGSRQTCILIM